MTNTAMKGYLATILGIVVDALAPAIKEAIGGAPAAAAVSHASPSLWGLVAAVLVLVGTRIAHKAPPPGLQPTPIEVEDGGAALGKASGEAGELASRAVSRGAGVSAAATGAAPAPATSDK